MKTYTVTVTAKYPAYNEVPAVLEIIAETSQAALSKARAIVRNAGNQDSQSGPIYYSARISPLGARYSSS